MKGVTLLLKHAAAEIRDGNLSSALDAYIVVWSSTPDITIAILIGELTRRLQGSSVRAAKMTARQWELLFDEQVPASFGLLVDQVTRDSTMVAADRLESLLECPADPRLGEIVVRWLENPPYGSPASQSFWRAVCAVIGACNDTRVLAACSRAPKALADLSLSSWLLPRLESAAELLRYALSNQPKLTLEERELADAAIAELIASDLEGLSPMGANQILLARVRENPDDDNSRRIYALWLNRQNDPRGEIIRLQFSRRDGTGADEDLEQMLLREHAGSWLGSLGRELRRDRMIFQRGFVEHVELDASYGSPMRTSEDPAWGAVTSIRVKGAFSTGELVRLLSMPTLHSLRSVSGISFEVLEQLSMLPAAARLAHIEMVGGTSANDQAVRRLALRLPSLRTLEWRVPPTHGLVRRAASLECDQIRIANAVAPAVELARHSAGGWHLRLRLQSTLSAAKGLGLLATDSRFATVEIQQPDELLN